MSGWSHITSTQVIYLIAAATLGAGLLAMAYRPLDDYVYRGQKLGRGTVTYYEAVTAAVAWLVMLGTPMVNWDLWAMIVCALGFPVLLSGGVYFGARLEGIRRDARPKLVADIVTPLSVMLSGGALLLLSSYL